MELFNKVTIYLEDGHHNNDDSLQQIFVSTGWGLS